MKHLKTFKLTALAIVLLASACHKESNNESEIPYGVELITQPGDCECKGPKTFEMVDTVIYIFPGHAGDTVPYRRPYYLRYFKDTLLFWAGNLYMDFHGPVCNPPEILKNIEIPIVGLKIKTSADFYITCKPDDHGSEWDENNIILTSFIIQKP